MTLEESIKTATNNILTMFMELQVVLTLLANATEQSVDDETDFRICAEAEFKAIDIVEGMQYILSELPEIAAEIRDVPPSKEARAWWTAAKAERKIKYAALVAKRKEAAAAEKLERKALKEESKV